MGKKKEGNRGPRKREQHILKNTPHKRGWVGRKLLGMYPPLETTRVRCLRLFNLIYARVF